MISNQILFFISVSLDTFQAIALVVILVSMAHNSRVKKQADIDSVSAVEVIKYQRAKIDEMVKKVDDLLKEIKLLNTRIDRLEETIKAQRLGHFLKTPPKK